MRFASALLAICMLAGPALAQQSEEDLLAAIAADPANGAARLALAQIDYQRGRDDTAAFNARQALASGLTPEQAAEARDLLAALQAKRRWIATFDASLAPETSRTLLRDLDPANDTDTDVVTIQETSGFGAFGTASVENRLPLGETLRLSTRLDVNGTAYQEDQFDALNVTVRFGPLWLLGGDDRLSVRALVQTGWRGGDEDTNAYGIEAALTRSVGQRLVTFSRVTIREVDNQRFDSRDGQTYAVDGALTRYGLSGAFEQVFGLVFRSELEAANQSAWFGRIGAGAYRETGVFGLGIYASPTLAYTAFDGIDPLGAEGRSDWTGALTVRTVKRDWRVLGTSPYISLTGTYRDSNIDPYDDEELTVQAGFTRTF